MTAEPFLKLIARQLAKHHLDAVLIGNAAAALQGAPVTTIDFDVRFRAMPGNVGKVRRLAEGIGATVTQPFYLASTLYRVRRERDDLQIDFMSRISGIRSYEGLCSRATVARFGRHPMKVASLDDVIRSKAAANRPEDRADGV